MKGFFCLVFSLYSFFSWATEYQPWIGNYFEYEWRNFVRYQTYSQVASKSCHYHSHDYFLTASLSLAAKPNFSLEGEATMASTRKQSGGIDQLRLNGRYVWSDDIAGDAITLTTGASFIQSFPWSLKDISSFHHGRSEAEVFVSAGKERTQADTWAARYWGMLGVGFAERGSAWIRAHLSYEQRIRDNHALEVFARSLWGLGHKELSCCHFHGYGPIQHQSIDLGLRYTYFIEFVGAIFLEYAGRVHARYFPAHAQQVTLQVLYTFGP